VFNIQFERSAHGILAGLAWLLTKPVGVAVDLPPILQADRGSDPIA